MWFRKPYRRCVCVCETSLLGQVRVFSTRPSSFTPLSSPTLSFHSPHTPLLSLFHCSSSTQAGQLPCVKFPPRPLSLPSCTGSYVTLWDSYFSFFFFFVARLPGPVQGKHSSTGCWRGTMCTDRQRRLLRKAQAVHIPALN